VITLSALASYSGGAGPAFQAGVDSLMLKPGAYPMERLEQTDYRALAASLARFAEADAPTRQKILNACNQAVRQDGVIQPREAALMRAISDVLAAPMIDPENVA
jgi:hypothetical protein